MKRPKKITIYLDSDQVEIIDDLRSQIGAKDVGQLIGMACANLEYTIKNDPRMLEAIKSETTKINSKSR